MTSSFPLKEISIVLTGMFGMLGLLTEFRDERKKVTGWGMLSLAGILISTAIAAIIQHMDSEDALQQSIALQTDANKMLLGINRTLSPIGGSTLELSFTLNCSQDSGAASVCAGAKKAYYDPDGTGVTVENDPIDAYVFHYELLVFAQAQDAKPWASEVFWHQNFKLIYKTAKPALFFTNGGGEENRNWSDFPRADDTSLGVDSYSKNVFMANSDGSMRSMQDLPGKLAVVVAELGGTYLTPNKVILRNQNGEAVDCDHLIQIPTPRLKIARAFTCILNGHTNAAR
jgi:hypothetical protein